MSRRSAHITCVGLRPRRRTGCAPRRPSFPRAQGVAVLLIVTALVPAACRKQEEQTAQREKTRSWFRVLDESFGGYVHETGADGAYHFPEIMGGGIAWFDADGDGLLDLYVTNGHRHLPAPQPDGSTVNHLFVQRDGRFVDATESSGLGDGGYGMGVGVGDFNNDGLVDVYVSNFGPDAVYFNEGRGRFVPSAQRDLGPGWSTSVAVLDYDRDGWLDVFVARYVELNDLKECSDNLGRPDYCSPKAFHAVHDLLYRNSGDGTFVDVSEQAGVASVAAAGLGVATADFNGDGWIDLYVANDAYANHLWINKQDGTFVDEALMSGSALNMSGQVEAGMGVLAADFDNDADFDLFMTHLRFESNTYYENDGTGLFTDRTGSQGLAAPSLPYTGFGASALDIEMDGDLDIVLVNGAVVRGAPHEKCRLPEPWRDYAEPDAVYINTGSAQFAEGDAGSFGALVGAIGVSRGLACGDMDNDGDMDLAIARLSAAPRILINDAPRKGAWLGVRALTGEPQRMAIGATVTLTTARGRRPAVIGGGQSYLSAGDLRVMFTVPEGVAMESLHVDWPDGLRESFPCGESNRYVTLVQGTGRNRDE